MPHCSYGEFSRDVSGEMPCDRTCDVSHGISNEMPYSSKGELLREKISCEVLEESSLYTIGDFSQEKIARGVAVVIPSVTTAPFTHGGNGDILNNCCARNVDNGLISEDIRELLENDDNESSDKEFTDCLLAATDSSSNETMDTSVCDDVCWNCCRNVQTGIFNTNCYNLELSNHLCDDLKTSKKFSCLKKRTVEVDNIYLCAKSADCILTES